MMETKLEQSTLHPLCRYAAFNSLSIDAICRAFYYPTANSSEEKWISGQNGTSDLIILACWVLWSVSVS